MAMMRTHLMVLAVATLPFSALAEAEGSANGQPSVLSSLFWTLLPIVFVTTILVLFLRKVQKPMVKRSQDHMARQLQHMERVEQLLERIANAVEKK